MKLILIIFALITLTILSSAITPADVVRQNKVGGPLALDLRNTNPAVFNSTAFSNQNPNPGHLNSSATIIPQNEVGVTNSDISFLTQEISAPVAEPDFGTQVAKQNKIIHGSSSQANASQNKTLTNQSV